MNLTDLDAYFAGTLSHGIPFSIQICDLDILEELLEIIRRTENHEAIAQRIRDAITERMTQEDQPSDIAEPELTADHMVTARTQILEPSADERVETLNEVLLREFMFAFDLNNMADIRHGELRPSRSPGGPTTWPRGIITALRTFVMLDGSLRELHEQLSIAINERLASGRGRQGGATVADVETVRDWLREKRETEEASAARQTSEAVHTSPRAETVPTDNAQNGLQDDDSSAVSEEKTQWTSDLSRSLSAHLAQHQGEMTPTAEAPTSDSSKRKRRFEAVEQDELNHQDEDPFDSGDRRLPSSPPTRSVSGRAATLRPARRDDGRISTSPDEIHRNAEPRRSSSAEIFPAYSAPTQGLVPSHAKSPISRQAWT